MLHEFFATIPLQSGALRVRYFVTSPVLAEELPHPCYGIGISDGNTTYIAPTFCPKEDEAVRMAKLLCRHQVTPVTFWDVLEDYLAAL